MMWLEQLFVALMQQTINKKLIYSRLQSVKIKFYFKDNKTVKNISLERDVISFNHINPSPQTALHDATGAYNVATPTLQNSTRQIPDGVK